MTGKIIICRADEMLETVATHQPVAVLSIEHPDVAAGESGAAPRIDGAMPVQKILSFWDSETPVVQGPTFPDVEAGVAFIMAHIAQGDVLVHCHAGKARSAGIVLGALALLHPDDDENALIGRLLEIRPIAAPNILVVEMVDKIAGREGRLLDAVLNHPGLTAAREKTEKGRQAWLTKNLETYKKIHPEKFPPPQL